MNLFKSFDSGLGQYMRKAPPTPWAAWNHQIYAAGGASGFTTMVVMFVVCLCCCGWTRDITSSAYVKNGTKITLR
jgi:hypothetical protein